MMDSGWSRQRTIVSMVDHASVASEQFRKLQARMRALKRATGGRLSSVVVTSPLMGEGKTTCAANLAVALATEPGHRVLLLDCDLRKPQLHSFLQEDPPLGLLDLLNGRKSSEEVAVRMPGGNLDVIVLRSEDRRNGNRLHTLPIERLKVVLKSLEARYDFIVCDGPPLLPSADAGALVDVCDGALLVVRAGVTSRPATAKAIQAIDKQKLIGFLLNAVPEKRMDKYYYKYQSEEDG